MSKPSIPKGTRDFNPSEMARRNYIFDTIKSVFKLYGYQSIETPAIESLSTLMGKYGEEGDRLLFKILNSGDFLDTLHKSGKELSSVNYREIENYITEKGLRYDLTVPFARYVVQNRNSITFPFKRYQIQPVWRADRPQRGRYREFYQCDVDVIGSDSLLNEFELLQIVDDVFSKLNVSITIKLNNRKILTGIAEISGQADKITDITTTIDKLDNIGLEMVKEELIKRGITIDAIKKIEPILLMKGSFDEKIENISVVLGSNKIGKIGIEELQNLFAYIKNGSLNCKVELDLSLARGLNYYTGAIIEVIANDIKIGSICGGGRYDNLTGVFGMPGVSGVGISFGADRIYDVINELNLFPPTVESTSMVMFANFGPSEENFCLALCKQLREAGIHSEIFPDSSKIKKQMAYANNKKIPFVVIAGTQEIQNNEVAVKNMNSGEQLILKVEELLRFFLDSKVQ